MRGPIQLPEERGLRLQERDFKSALAAIPSGYGEGEYEGLVVRRHHAQSLATQSGPACSRERSRGGDVVSFNLNRLRSGEDLCVPVKGRPRRSSLSFSGTLLTHRGFCQGCVVSCDACVAASVNGRRAQIGPRCSGGPSPSTQLPLTRRPRRAPPPSTSRAGTPRQPQRTAFSSRSRQSRSSAIARLRQSLQSFVYRCSRHGSPYMWYPRSSQKPASSRSVN